MTTLTVNQSYLRRILTDLRAGHDILIVAMPHTRSVEIAQLVCRLARENGLKCANLPECGGAGPRVRVREYMADIPFPTPKAKVHVDVSAVFERGMIVPKRVRTVGSGSVSRCTCNNT